MEHHRWTFDIKDRSGAVLISVLVIVASLISLTVTQTERASTEYEGITLSQNRLQGYIYCSTALKGLVKVFDEDDNYYDHPGEGWAEIPPLPTPEGYVYIRVVPLNSRLPLRMLTSKDDQMMQRIENAIREIDPDIDIDGLREYLKQDTPFSIGELYIHRDEFGMKAKDISFFNTEETDGKININFAPPEVLTAYLPELETYVDEIIKYRDEHPFEDISELRKVPGIDDELYLQIQKFITVKSSYFYVQVSSEVNKTTVDVTAVMRRSSGKTKVVKYFEKAKVFYGKT
ncbi:MAG: general secretion pathway protein GspK [Nitrospirae bacterium]|nr:general secretion pathway protein GspK [Nitrospirota bacterium]